MSQETNKQFISRADMRNNRYVIAHGGLKRDSRESELQPIQTRYPLSGKTGLALVLLSFLMLMVAILLLLGHPLLGKAWVSWMTLGSIAITMLTLSLSGSSHPKSLTDLRQLRSGEQYNAIEDVMHTRLATKENGVHIYRGYLLSDSHSAFEHVSRSLEPNGALVMLEPDDRMEARITIVPKSSRAETVPPRIKWVVHLMLFCITAITATFAGAIHQGVNPLSTSPHEWAVGLPYAFSLLTILGVHEAGHYAVARFYHMNVTPPFFIPAPLPLGTFGAVISMRSPSRTRRIMFDTAAAGPLLGFVASLIFLAIGLSLTKTGASVFSSDLLAPKPGSSALFTVVAALMNPGLHYGASLSLHPFAFAGWLGLLITAVNLIPVGQLDGGRMGHALLGAKSGDILSRVALAVLIGLALFVWPNLLIFSMLVFFLAGRSDRALDDMTPLGPARTVIGVFSFICLLAILLPIPAPVFHWMLDQH